MMKKWHEILMTFGIIVVLLLLSFALLKFPKLYFEHSDDNLNGVVSIGAYDIDNEIKPMSMTQLLDVFKKEDVLMVEEEAPVLDKELLDKLVNGTLKDFLRMIFNKDFESYVYMLTEIKEGAAYVSSAYTVLDVENDEIYSVRVGAMSLDYTMYPYNENVRIDIVFNSDTYDILAVSLSDMNFLFDFWACIDKADMLTDKLNEYYGMELSWDNLWNGDIAIGYLRVAPWGYETQEKRIFRTMISRMYETGYQYVDVTELLQE